MKYLKLFLIITTCCISINSISQKADTVFAETNNSKAAVNKKLLYLTTGMTVSYVAGMTGLYQLWYKDFEHSSFHFTNDNKAWQQMDKLGHSYSTYTLSQLGYNSFRWAGVDENRSVLFGSLTGFVLISSIEFYDGFSKQWGASPGDLIANTAGTLIFASQQFFWKEQKIKMKWSAHYTDFAKHNPKLLGDNFTQRLLKDYNCQTYWLSFNVCSFGLQETMFPKWINIAVGHSANGMTGGQTNVVSEYGYIPNSERYRQWYISPDIDFSKIETNSKFLKSLFVALNVVKMPLPAVCFDKKGVKFHPIYF